MPRLLKGTLEVLINFCFGVSLKILSFGGPSLFDAVKKLKKKIFKFCNLDLVFLSIRNNTFNTFNDDHYLKKGLWIFNQ